MQDSSYVISGNVANWVGTNNAYTGKLVYDLGNTVSNDWTLRMKWRADASSYTSNGKLVMIGLTDKADGRNNQAQDFLGFSGWSPSNRINISYSDNAQPTYNVLMPNAFPTGADRWIEVKRTSDTSYTVTVYSDSSYSSVVATLTETISANITGLRYLTIASAEFGAGDAGSFNGIVDDLTFTDNG